MDDVIIRRVGNVPTVIETVVNPLTGEDIDQQYVCVTLVVQLTPNYPDTSPDVVLRNPRGLDDDLIASIHSQIKIKLADCLGQPVVFELIDVSILLCILEKTIDFLLLSYFDHLL